VGRPLLRRTKVRMLAGFVLVPPTIGLLTFVGFLLLHSLRVLPYSGGLVDPTGAAASVALAVGILAFLVTVAGALPGVLWLAGRGPLRLRQLLALGAALGNVPLLLIIVGATLVNLAAGTLERGRGLYDLDGTVVRVLIGVVCGTAGAATFWLVAVRGTELDEHDAAHDSHTGDRHASLGTR